LTQVAKRLGIKIQRSRARITNGDSSERPYLYQVYTPELVAAQIKLLAKKLESEIDASPDKLAALDKQLESLKELQSQIQVRKKLLRSALVRYEAVLSTLFIDEKAIKTLGHEEADQTLAA
jgi:hypothetical protein